MIRRLFIMVEINASDGLKQEAVILSRTAFFLVYVRPKSTFKSELNIINSINRLKKRVL